MVRAVCSSTGDVDHRELQVGFGNNPDNTIERDIWTLSSLTSVDAEQGQTH